MQKKIDIVHAFAIMQSEHRGCYVSLYERSPFYGGPQEGGWWGEDTTLVSTIRCADEAEAYELCERVQLMAKRLTTEAQNEHGRTCLRECEWLEARGLDSDYLGEVDGPNSYFVVVESRCGENENVGSRRWDD